MNRDLLLKLMKEDYKEAKTAKVIINQQIAEWNKAYEFEGSKAKPSFIKEIAKLIELQKPNITEPFLSTDNPMEVNYIPNRIHKNKIERFLNNTFINDTNREDLINTSVDLLIREGTVWCKTSWKREFITKMMYETVTAEDVVANNINLDEMDEVHDLGDGTFSIGKRTRVQIANHPISTVCRNEFILPDPNARSKDDMNFLIEERYVTFYDLAEEGRIDKETLAKLKSKMEADPDGVGSPNSLEIDRNEVHQSYGGSLYTKSNNINRRKIKILEYWGYYSEGDSEQLPIMAIWSDDYDMVLFAGENPMPSKKIPYKVAVYSAKAFSLWGNSLVYFLLKNQQTKNGIVKGILNNLDLANNGQKFIKKTAIDFENFKRLRSKERYILMNQVDGIVDGKYNAIPAETFKFMNTISEESNVMAGVDGSTLDGDSMSKEDDDKITLAQQKMISIVRIVGKFIAEQATEWLQMAEIWLDDEQIIEAFSDDGNPDNDQVDINMFRNSNKTKIGMRVATRVANQVQLQQLNMLMQQAKALGETIPQESIKALVAKMFGLFNMHNEGIELLEYVPEPDPVAEQMKQLQLQEQQMKVAKLQAEIQQIGANSQLLQANAMNSVKETDANVMYKGAQANEKIKKAESHEVENALSPTKLILEAQKQNKEGMNDRTGKTNK